MEAAVDQLGVDKDAERGERDAAGQPGRLLLPRFQQDSDDLQEQGHAVFLLSLFSKTFFTWSLTSALEMSASSFAVGTSSGMSGRTMEGKASKAPTMDVASVRGTPFSSPVEIRELVANRKSWKKIDLLMI